MQERARELKRAESEESRKGELRDPLTCMRAKLLWDQYYCVLEGQMFKAKRNGKRYTLYNARYNSTGLWASISPIRPVCVTDMAGS